MTMDKITRTSMPAVTPYKRIRINPVKPEERKREKESLKVYRIGGDAS